MKCRRLAIIDYGMGNLHSVASAIRQVAPEVEVLVTPEREAIDSADHIIFPGVGAIRDCMAEINRLHVGEQVRAALAVGKPVLAICVGMQALMDHSDENNGVECLRVLPGQVRRFAAKQRDSRTGEVLKVPHMGWNQVTQTIDHPLWQGIDQDSRFYFVHSYHVQAAHQEQIAGLCTYGVEFTAALYQDSLFAAQFHPEKSHTAGLRLYQNFVHWDGKL
jgi:glutamine amidotransferase